MAILSGHHIPSFGETFRYYFLCHRGYASAHRDVDVLRLSKLRKEYLQSKLGSALPWEQTLSAPAPSSAWCLVWN